MSATALRDGAKSDIEELITTETGLLFSRKDISSEEMRDRVAYIRGLNDAIHILTERYRKLHA